jgi:hypothetical protein
MHVDRIIPRGDLRNLPCEVKLAGRTYFGDIHRDFIYTQPAALVLHGEINIEVQCWRALGSPGFYTPNSAASSRQSLTLISAGRTVAGHTWFVRFIQAVGKPAARAASTSNKGSSPT